MSVYPMMFIYSLSKWYRRPFLYRVYDAYDMLSELHGRRRHQLQSALQQTKLEVRRSPRKRLLKGSLGLNDLIFWGSTTSLFHCFSLFFMVSSLDFRRFGPCVGNFMADRLPEALHGAGLEPGAL